MLKLRPPLFHTHFSLLFNLPSFHLHRTFSLSLSFSSSTSRAPNPSHAAAKASSRAEPSESSRFVRKVLFVPPGMSPDEVTDDMVLPGSNIVIGPYAGDAKVNEVDFVKSSNRAKDCPKDDRPEFAMLGRSNVGKSSLINFLVRKKDVALTSKKPGKTQLINHFLINKSWYIVDLPGYGVKKLYGDDFVSEEEEDHNDNRSPIACRFLEYWSRLEIFSKISNVNKGIVRLLSSIFANAPESARMDWSSFTKGYFLNRETLVSVLLLVDASVPPQKIDLDCANWLGRNNISMTFVFTKCDKMKGGKGRRPDENIRDFQELIRENYGLHPPWIMTSSVTGLGRDELLLHMSQLRNYWDNE